MSRNSKLLIICLMMFLLISNPSMASEFVITLLHTNDLHGRVFPFDDRDLGEGVGGYARIASLAQQIKGENPYTLLLDGGDKFSGTPVSSFFKGEAELLGALLAGYDVMAIGNHEFDYGQDTLRNYIDYFPLPLIGANIVYNDLSPFAPSHVIFELNGVRVLVMGLITTTTYTSTHPRNVVGLDFLDPVTVTRNLLQEQAGNYDVFVVLSHMGHGADLELAAAVEGIDVIIGGHSHTKVDEPVFVGETLVTQAYQWSLFLGKVDLTIRDGQVVDKTSTLLPLTNDIPENPLVKQMLHDLYDVRIAEEMSRVIGYTPVDLVRTPSGAIHDSNIGNFVTDALRWATGADLAVYNNGGIRADLPKGDLTVGDMYTIEPFGNYVMTVEVTKEQLVAMFNHMASRGGEQLSGASYVVVDGQAQDILVGGQPLSADRTYVVATQDFMGSGGSRYTMLAEGKNHTLYNLVRDTYIEFLQANPGIEYRIEGRITTR